MNYQVLDPQQLLVFSRVYSGVEGTHKWEPEAILTKVHCCPNCTCSYLNEPAKTEFSQRLAEAETSGQFHELFVSWNYDSTALALFGILKAKSQKSLTPFVLLGEWGNDLPSYDARLAKLRKTYRSWWPGRLLAGLLLGVAVIFLYKSFTYALARDYHTVDTFFIGFAAAMAGGIPAYHSLKKYLRLFRYHRPATT
jgi:hypothetical protein